MTDRLNIIFDDLVYDYMYYTIAWSSIVFILQKGILHKYSVVMTFR